MLFYFTATGNSLYVAKKLERKPISIPQIVHQSNLTFKDEKIGIVAPVYGHEVPDMVKEFLKNATFQTDYFYIILTYGNRHGGAAELTYQFCQKHGIKVHYINVIKMVDNYLPSFDMNEQKALDKHEDDHIQLIQSDIHNKKRSISSVTDEDRQAHQQYLSNRAKIPEDIFKNLYHVTEECIGCGICTKVCPAGCIELKNEKIIYRTEYCQTCMACIHHCPKKAIQLNIFEKNPQARYRHKEIALSDIVEANYYEK